MHMSTFLRVVCALVGVGAVSLVQAAPPETRQRLKISQARVCVTGADHNRPADYRGIGDFIGWPGGLDRMPNGDLLLTHSAGYWHSSFAQPRQIEPELHKRWLAEGWPLEFAAPTGGRTMACRSTDGGRTWSKPFTIVDHRLDDGAHAVMTLRKPYCDLLYRCAGFLVWLSPGTGGFCGGH